MTDPNELAARLESVLDRLDRLGLTGPTPTPTVAVDPDGYPGAVVSGELIESAWGNAVVDKLHEHGDQLSDSWTQYGVLIAVPISGNTYEIEWPEPFAGTPAVSIMNGDTAAVALAVFGLVALDADKVHVKVNQPDGTAVTGSFRFIWIAAGPKA